MTDQQDKKDSGDLMTSPARRTLSIDVDRYQQYLDGSGFSDEEKRVYIESLWSIIVMFVDLGYELSPVQKFSGEAITKAHATLLSQPDVISSKSVPLTTNLGGPRSRSTGDERIPS